MIIVILAIFGIGAWLYSNRTDTDPAEQSARYMDIESYVRNSISELSPVKEQLGGTFYVTSIETHGGTGIVSYEDGHNAYTADFTYTIDEEGKPTIDSFIVRE